MRIVDVQYCIKEYALLNNTLKNNVPKNIEEHILFFSKLDREYKQNCYDVINDDLLFSYKHIKNKEWDKIWYKPTGQDAKLYINWIYSGIKYEKYREGTLKEWYEKEHPREKYVPYSITLANEDLHKLLNDNKKVV